MKPGTMFNIHCYKHDGTIHRIWDEALLLEVHDDYLVFGNNKTKVIESDGRCWKTKEPAIMYFYNKSWFNVIGQLKKNGIYYYCNIASPYVIDGNTIKYIDYDLDLRVFPNGSYKILDKGEYKYHSKLMNYSKELDVVLNSELKNLVNIARRRKEPFNSETVKNYYNKYVNLKKKTV